MYGDFDREIGEARIEQERDAQVDAARKALKQMGTEECVGCGDLISSARRQAMPSATRCITCQQIAEAEGGMR